MRNLAQKIELKNEEKLTIVLYGMGVDIDHDSCQDLVIVYYEIQRPTYPLLEQGELHFKETEWSYEEDRHQLSLSNAVLILNALNQKHELWFFNGTKFELFEREAQSVLIENHISALNQNSIDMLSQHYFDTPLEVK